ncbi:signal recognition particle 54kDa subunit [Ostreococcus tauri]|uniref:Signal recognition particle 54 kDa protein n=1 Tax=Ostreococcus tauri TaxID=70448 RepID=A0A1Y5I1R9_OSTTA|nr:signal recognition particle 54kDa subunit [Ostreococcus tauri]
MVLNDLGNTITSALRRLQTRVVIDDDAVDGALKEICNALLSADVAVGLVVRLKKNVMRAVETERASDAGGTRTRRTLERAVFKELANLLNGGGREDDQETPVSGPGGGGRGKRGREGGRRGEGNAPRWAPKKGKRNVVMFVGLQGAGKTTTCTKFAHYYARKGFKAALVCADTFRAGAFDQLKQNATKAKIPFYGSYTESDPAKIAEAGVRRFEEEKMDLIIVDTSGRHRQEEALFEEMREIANVTDPTMTIFVMDSSIGQSAADQANAFASTVDVGGVIMTKLDGHAKGGGAISAVSETKAPILFIGTGEHIGEMEPFDANSFVSKLLGMGDMKGLVEKMTEIVPEESAERLADAIGSGTFTMRLLYEQFQNLQNMGPISSFMSMVPGMADMMPKGSEQEGTKRMKSMMVLMDSMTDAELDAPNPKIFDAKRMERVARGAGRSPHEMITLLEEHKRLGKMMGKMKGMKFPSGNARGRGNPQQMQQQMAQMANALPPDMLRMMGGAGGLQNMMKQFDGMDPSRLQSMMKGMGGM